MGEQGEGSVEEVLKELRELVEEIGALSEREEVGEVVRIKLMHHGANTVVADAPPVETEYLITAEEALVLCNRSKRGQIEILAVKDVDRRGVLRVQYRNKREFREGDADDLKPGEQWDKVRADIDQAIKDDQSEME